MDISRDYTLADHQSRDSDSYALAKYRISLRWLESASPQGRLLNVGCGGGLFNSLAEDAGYSVVGVEPDSEAFRLALDRADGRYPVLHSGLFDFAADGTFDVVVLHDVLEHIDAEGSALDSIASLLKPFGHVVISVPASDLLFGFHDRQLGHFRRYSKASLRRALGDRFVIEKIRYVGMSGVPLVFWYSRVKKKPFPISNGSRGLVGSAFALASALEQRIPGPFGTSVMVLARVRSSGG